MEYKVIPLTANFNSKDKKFNGASDYLETLIKHYNNQGWDYVRIENLTTYVPGDNGCFGIGSTPGYTTVKQMIVFSKK